MRVGTISVLVAAALATVLAAVAGCGAGDAQRPADGAPGDAPEESRARPERAARRERLRAAPDDPPTADDAAPRGGEPPADTADGADAPRDTWEILPAGTAAPVAPERIAGRVVGPDGRPLAGVKVEMLSTWLDDAAADAACGMEIGQSWCGWEFTGARSSVVTDAQGAFSLRYVPGGARTLFVRDEDGTLAARLAAAAEPAAGDAAPAAALARGEPRWIAFDPPAGRAEEIVLTSGLCRVEGSVCGPDGAPVAGADVVLSTTSCPVPTVRGLGLHHCDPPSWTRAVTSDESGRWTCDEAPAGDVVVHASAVGFPSTTDRPRVRTSPAAPVRVDLRLEPPAASAR